MQVNDEYTADGDRRRARQKPWRGPERRIAPAARGQLLEEGDRPSGLAGTREDNPNEFTSDGGAGTDDQEEEE